MNNGIKNLNKAAGDVVLSSVVNLMQNQNNYSLPSGGIVRLSSTQARNISGFIGKNGDVISIFNVGSYDIFLLHESSDSIASNRITSATGADLVIFPNDNITLIYDGLASRWRTAGVVKTNINTMASVFDFTILSAPAGALSSGAGSWIWTVPDNFKFLRIDCIGSGAGGGSGRRGASLSTRGGGGAGGGGARTIYEVAVQNLPTRSLNVLVGGGGAGAAAQTVNDTDGNDGTSGNVTAVRYTSNNVSFWLCYAYWGFRGARGTTIGGAGSGAAWSGTFIPGSGGSGGTGAAGGAGGVGPQTSGSGGGGAGISSADGTFVGGVGGAADIGRAATNTVGGTAGTVGGGVGGNASGIVVDGGAGAGGGGGGSSINSASGAGGNGQFPGGGGGGGAASQNGFNSGAGGNGADGFIRITAW
jgi:hypothetical protein